jgi:hypothetical protein
MRRPEVEPHPHQVCSDAELGSCFDFPGIAVCIRAGPTPPSRAKCPAHHLNLRLNPCINPAGKASRNTLALSAASFDVCRKNRTNTIAEDG